LDAVRAHLEAQFPWGGKVFIAFERGCPPFELDGHERAAERALAAAYGEPVHRMGSGGSVPLVAKLKAAYPDAAFVLWGAQDADHAKIHAANESVSLDEVCRIALAEALLLRELNVNGGG
jgi:acetylornithine deacetylase/succinyl-diaminopimelate desuccinylase-like protein